MNGTHKKGNEVEKAHEGLLNVANIPILILALAAQHFINMRNGECERLHHKFNVNTENNVKFSIQSAHFCRAHKKHDSYTFVFICSCSEISEIRAHPHFSNIIFALLSSIKTRDGKNSFALVNGTKK